MRNNVRRGRAKDRDRGRDRGMKRQMIHEIKIRLLTKMDVVLFRNQDLEHRV